VHPATHRAAALTCSQALTGASSSVPEPLRSEECRNWPYSAMLYIKPLSLEQPAKNREEYLNEKLHGHDYACAADRSGNFPNCGPSFISKSQVAERRSSNRRHQFQPTSTECSRQLVRSDNEAADDAGRGDYRCFGSVQHSLHEEHLTEHLLCASRRCGRCGVRHCPRPEPADFSHD